MTEAGPGPIERAQRWHDTDHGFLIGVDPTVHPAISTCWCCCEECNPEWTQRPNPFWGVASHQLLMRFT
ncbi:MAG: hypothetical protein ABWX96_17645 [Propionibacteriaceae bacterium]